MSLSSALQSAVGGLTVTARQASIVSENISNALTEGYGRREAELATRNGITMVAGVVRHVDPVLLSDRRLAGTELAFSDTMGDFAARMEQLFGTPEAGDSLTAQLTRFETRLIEAAGDPSSTNRLINVAEAATALADKINALSYGVEEARTLADAAIDKEVEQLNDSLREVETLNARISAALNLGADTSSLEDQRQQVIDRIAAQVPVRSVERDRGAIALYTAGGAVLLDGSAAEIGFQRTNVVAPQMTLENGLLNGLTLNGRPVSAEQGRALGGGSLGAQFEIRDVVGVEMNARLDGLARDLAERFDATGPDATLAVGDPGLFTDAGAAALPANEVGLAQRLSLNAMVAPDSATIWKLRDGLGAAVQGNVGDATLINDLRDVLLQTRVPGSAALPPIAQTASVRAADLVSFVADYRVDTDRAIGFASAQHTTLRELEFSKGVDTDAELQNLLQLEQSYAANARVITAIDEMMQLVVNM